MKVTQARYGVAVKACMIAVWAYYYLWLYCFSVTDKNGDITLGKDISTRSTMLLKACLKILYYMVLTMLLKIGD